MRLFGFEITRKPKAVFDLRTIKRVKLSEDDVLIIHVSDRLTGDAANQLRSHVSQVFPKQEIVVLDKGISMTVVSQDYNEPDSE